jgi:hypothetical protein
MKNVFVPLRTRPVMVLLLSTITAANAFCDSAIFYGVGQLPGGALNSQIRDAVVTSTGILAAGSAQQNPSSAVGDTAVIWTPATGLQTLATLNNVSVPPNSRFVTASQISTGNNVIAARINTDATGRDVLPALYNPGGPLTAILGVPEGLVWGAANGISSDGKIVYGFDVDPSGDQLGYRWTLATGAVQLPGIEGYTSIILAPRGCSGDGTIAAGVAVTADGTYVGPGSMPFEFNSASGISLLPLPPGGTWAAAAGIEPSGTYIVGNGDTPANPNGEALLWTNGTVSTLGVPAAEAATGFDNNFAAVTRDGTAIVIGGEVGSYIYNAYGWSDLQTALAAGGADLTGWSVLSVRGMNADGTLVFGSGNHGGGVEGFVAQLPAGYLKHYGKPAKTKG